MIGIAEAKRLVSECFPRRTGQTLAFCADTRPLAGSLRPGGDGGLEICVNLRPISREKIREAGNLRARFTVCYLEEEARRLPAMAARKIWLPPMKKNTAPRLNTPIRMISASKKKMPVMNISTAFPN